MRRSVAGAGLPKAATPYSLHHSFATHLMEAGVEQRSIQALPGHRAPKSTEVYLYVSNKTVMGIAVPLTGKVTAMDKPTVQDVFEKFYPAYLKRYSPSTIHAKTVRNIINCKTGTYEENISVCEDRFALPLLFCRTSQALFLFSFYVPYPLSLLSAVRVSHSALQSLLYSHWYTIPHTKRPIGLCQAKTKKFLPFLFFFSLYLPTMINN